MLNIEKTLTFRIGFIIGLIHTVILIKIIFGSGNISGFLTIMAYSLIIYGFCGIIINLFTLILIFIDIILLRLMQKTKVTSNIALRIIKYVGFISYIFLNIIAIVVLLGCNVY